MLKPASLRNVLTGAVPELKRDPALLRIWSDKGRIAGRLGGPLGFEYRYRLNVLIIDFTGSEDAIAIAIVNWLREHQPDLLLNHDRGDQAVPFEVEVIDTKTVDLLFELELSETVRVIPRDAGGFDAVHEPEPSLDDLLLGEPIGGLTPPRPPLTQIYFGDTLILDAGDE